MAQIIFERAPLRIPLILKRLIESHTELFHIRGAPLIVKELAEEILEESL